MTHLVELSKENFNAFALILFQVKPTVALKHIHSEQVAKLQAKHQQECDLLEDIR